MLQGHRLAGARDVDPRDLVAEPISDLPRGWWVRDLFDRLLGGWQLVRRVGLEVDEWFGVLTMVHRGMGVSYGPRACIDDAVFDDVAMGTLAGARSGSSASPPVTRHRAGGAGRAFLQAYRQHCRGQATS